MVGDANRQANRKMRLKLLLMLLLCSCATQRQAEKFFDRNTDKLADYVDKNQEYTQDYGGAYAAKYFPPKFYPPALYTSQPLVPGRLTPTPTLDRAAVMPPTSGNLICPDCKGTYTVKTVYVEDTTRLDAIRMDLNVERRVNSALREQLKDTEADRDYWREMNRKKFWTLIIMAIFAALYILFKVLAARVREA